MKSGEELGTIQGEDPGALDALLGLVSRCPEAPSWSSDIWRSYLSCPAEDVLQRVLLGARDQRGRLRGLVAFTTLDASTELEMLLVDPASRREGWGLLLARQWLLLATRKGAKQALLEVRASNTAAQRLYGRLGFEEQGRRSRYYRHPEEDAILMRKSIWPDGTGDDECATG